MANGIFLGESKRFYWNIDGNVGPACPNLPDDVALVHLAFFCKANNPKNPPVPADKAIYGAVTPGANYTGGYNDPLSVAIRRAQQERGGTQDGRVSVIKGVTYAPGTTWMLVALDNNISDVIGSAWPFIDRHPQCPASLKAAVSRVLVIPPG